MAIMTSKTFLNTSMVALVAGAGIIVGCGSDDEDPVNNNGGAAGAGATAGSAGSSGSGGTAGSGGSGGSTSGPTAALRVVHASPGAPAVDVYAAGSDTPAVSGLAYGDASPYLDLPPGSYAFDIRAAGSPATEAPAFTTPMVALAADKKYTTIASGDLASTDDADKFRVLALEEGFSDPGAGNWAIRAVHGAFDAGTVDLDVGDDGSAEVSDFAVFADTGAAGVPLPAGVALQVGILAGGNRVTAFTTPEIPEGTEVFVIATGRLAQIPRADEGFALLAVLPDSTTAWIRQNPTVYALHASPDAPPVDIYAGDAEIVDNAAFGEMAPVQVPPGDYTLDIFAGAAGATPKPSTAPVASPMTGMLEAGERYLAIALGELSGTNQPFALEVYKDEFALDDAGNSLVRAVHASANAPNVDIGPVATAGTLDSALLSDVPFAAASPGAGESLAPGALTLGFAAAGTTATVAEFDLTLTAGMRHYAIAGGNIGDATNGFQLIVVDTTASPWAAVSVAPK